MMNWQGVWVAIVTPFRKGSVDVPALQALVKGLLDAGVQGICPCGTTGEGATLTDSEFTQVVEAVMAQSNGKACVVPGTGTADTEKTIARTKLAKKLGTEGALVVTPYYVKPTQDGLIRHYSRIAESADFPMMLYNVPGRTAVNMLPSTVEKLSVDSRIAAVKECAPLNQAADLIRRVGERVAVFTGEDGVFLPFLVLGGRGTVSVVANVVPERWVEIYLCVQKGDWVKARTTFLSLGPFIETLFIESNPIPVKAALEMLGWIDGELRSPLAPISEPNRKRLKEELSKLGLRSLK
ncbi:MAG TPA: 4-hydroxy-tetrahydrodipicolinate synthase [Bdellovibrionota bacterium]|nr:4-hydroxy-tetrahydrodipicolinate synthase [Bdellovibrionota bacterium]